MTDYVAQCNKPMCLLQLPTFVRSHPLWQNEKNGQLRWWKQLPNQHVCACLTSNERLYPTYRRELSVDVHLLHLTSQSTRISSFAFKIKCTFSFRWHFQGNVHSPVDVLQQRFPNFSGSRPTCKYRGNLGTR